MANVRGITYLQHMVWIEENDQICFHAILPRTLAEDWNAELKKPSWVLPAKIWFTLEKPPLSG